MTRTRIVLSICTAATLILTGCGVARSGADSAAPAPVMDEVSAEFVALQEVGFTEEEAKDDAKKDGPRPRAIRKQLRKNTLHGEIVVETREGVRTVVVQRGTVTAVTETGLTLKSTDGFELTWTYGDPLRIVKNREKVERDALKTGAEIGVGGLREGTATTARLIILK
ncbi:hypothetical protein AB0M02_18980 [Actinoplanes sp. NPDC051861]|uniref:hypothetical protein n=1 Tax=Actinoplanes sp. NPDC051861 TaxID=3155170 RepID=UPI00341957FB